MRKPYLIRTPQFDPTSGGIRVMYGLYGHLLAKGEITHLNAQTDVPSVGIYPEIYSGNDMNATKVIRWILQKPQMMATNGVTGPSTEEIKATSDDIYVFSRVFDTIGVEEDHILFLPILNLKSFKDQDIKRTKTCYIVGKGINQKKHPENSIELTRELAQDQDALSHILNKSTTLYCYDSLTAMMEIARLCGCKVQYYGDLTPQELALYETGLNGIGYQNEKTTLAVDTFRKHYIGMIKTFEERLGTFIERTQQL